MRTLCTFLFSSVATFCMSQNIPIDFEQGGHGAYWTWTTFENDVNPPLEMVLNPDPTGINPSTVVAKFTALQAGQPWAGFESMHGADIGSFSLDTSNCIVKIMVWKSVISDVGIKFVDAGNAAQPEKKVSNTVVDQWEELTFDFTDRIGMFPIVKDQIVIFPDFDLNGRTKDNVIYIDNVFGLPENTSGLSGQQNATIRLIPNPTKDVIRIENAQGPIRVEIFDAFGKWKKSSNSTLIDIAEFPNGIYFFHIRSVDRLEVMKVVKE